MLTLTRRVGESIRIGPTTCVTVYDRLRYHVMIGVLTAPDAELRVGAEHVRAAVLPDGSHFRLLTLLSGEAFTLGSARIAVRFRTTYLGVSCPSRRQLKVDIHAPLDTLILREELHVKECARSREGLPPVPVADWLRKANQRISTAMTALPSGR